MKHFLINKLYFYRLKPTHKDLAKQNDAVQCAQAIIDYKRAFSSSNWPLAKDYLDQALRYADASASLLIDRSWCWFHLGEQYDTIADTGKALKLEVDNMEALELRGRAYYIIGTVLQLL